MSEENPQGEAEAKHEAAVDAGLDNATAAAAGEAAADEDAAPAAAVEVLSLGRGGEIELELHGLTISEVDAAGKDRGIITFSLEDSSSEELALGAEIEGRLVLFTKASVLADVGQRKFAVVNVTGEEASRLRCGERLAMVVVGEDAGRSVVALAPAAAEEVALRSGGRTPVEALEVGMELDGYVQSLANEGVFLDINAARSVVLPYRKGRFRKTRGRHRRPAIGDRLRLRVTRVDAARGHANVDLAGGD